MGVADRSLSAAQASGTSVADLGFWARFPPMSRGIVAVAAVPALAKFINAP